MAVSIDISDAIRKNNIKYFTNLIDNYDINEVTETSESLVLIAVKNNRKTILDTLIDMNADLLQEDMLGDNVITYAAKHNMINVFKTLKTKNKLNEYINSINSDNNSALLIASQNNHEELVLYLLKQDANPDIQNKEGNTAIMEAAINNNLKIIKHLVDYNANLDILNINNYSILSILIDNNSHNIINYILHQDINIWDDEVDYLGHSFHVDNKNLYELLLSRGVRNYELFLELIETKDVTYLNLMIDYINEINSEVIDFLLKRIKKCVKSKDENIKKELEYYTNIFDKLINKECDIKILKRKRLE